LISIVSKRPVYYFKVAIILNDFEFTSNTIDQNELEAVVLIQAGLGGQFEAN
jgi:hypothetical protein